MQIYYSLLLIGALSMLFSCEQEEQEEAAFSFTIEETFTIDANVALLGTNVTATERFENVTNLLLPRLEAEGLSIGNVEEVRANSVTWTGLNAASLNIINEASMDVDDFSTLGGGLEFAFIPSAGTNTGNVLQLAPNITNVRTFMTESTFDMIAKYKLRSTTNFPPEVRVRVVFDVVLN